MLDAMFAKPAADPAADAGRPRDEHGRFLPKPGEAAPLAATAADPTKPGAIPAKPLEPDDPTKMPEGLQPKAQERFQLLANTNKELSGKVEQLGQQVEYVRETFHTHGITREQFEHAAGFIGAINKGDFDSALEIIEAQRAQLSLALGKALPGVDALSDFPDLRGEVDNLQITEARALEIARHRLGQHAQAQRVEQERTQQQTQQQGQQAFETGLKAVDAFCKQMQAADLDYAAIEARLTPQLKTLLDGTPPSLWEAKVRAQYQLIKEISGPARAALAPANVLRPTGQASPGAVPRTMFEAMFGKSQAA